MKNAPKTTTARCRSCGRYFFRTYRTRPPVYCLDCAEYTAKEGNKARQRAFRQRRKAKTETPAKRDSGVPPRPVVGGSLGSVPSAIPLQAGKGLYSDLPEPGRTTKRKRVGLP